MNDSESLRRILSTMNQSVIPSRLFLFVLFPFVFIWLLVDLLTAKNELIQNPFSSGGEHFNRVKELGIATDDGMMCLNNAQMLSIGAIGQLFNVIRGLAKRLGVSEDELYALAKQY